MNGQPVVDADGHVFEPDSLWEQYLDPNFLDQRPRLVTDERGTTRYQLEGLTIPNGTGRGAWAPEGIREASLHREGGVDPKARLVDMDEEGCGFLPYYLERLDEHFEKRAGEMPIERSPSETFAEGRCVVSCEPEEKSLAWVTESLGADKIVYASDYPHWDCEFPNSVRAISQRAELSDETKRAILCDNARRLYGLDR
jgi:hypothetical protein